MEEGIEEGKRDCFLSSAALPRRSPRFKNTSSIIRPAAALQLQRCVKRGREEGEGEVKGVTPKPKRNLQRPYLMSWSIVKAARVNNLPRVMLLHQKYRISLDSVCRNTWTVLKWASALGYEAIIDYALANQCDVNLATTSVGIFIYHTFSASHIHTKNYHL